MTIETCGLRLKFYPAVNLLYLWEDADYFLQDTELISRWLRPGDIAVDCGANVGQLTLVAAKTVGPAGAVYSIEAHPRTFQYLRHHVEMNDAANVRLVHAAVGAQSGCIRFSDQEQDNGNHVVDAGTGIEVSMLTVDEIVPAGTPIRLLKLDVEGYEKFALEGAVRSLLQTEAVYFESSDLLYGRYGYRCRDVFDLLEAAGLIIYQYGDRVVTRIAPDYHSVPIENLIALRDPAEFAARTGYELREARD